MSSSQPDKRMDGRANGRRDRPTDRHTRRRKKFFFAFLNTKLFIRLNFTADLKKKKIFFSSFPFAVVLSHSASVRLFNFRLFFFLSFFRSFFPSSLCLFPFFSSYFRFLSFSFSFLLSLSLSLSLPFFFAISFLFFF